MVAKREVGRRLRLRTKYAVLVREHWEALYGDAASSAAGRPIIQHHGRRHLGQGRDLHLCGGNPEVRRRLEASGRGTLLQVPQVGGPAPNPCSEQPMAGRRGRAPRAGNFKTARGGESVGGERGKSGAS